MSKKWTPELDSILLQGVFEECNISFGKALCDKIAARVRAAGIEGFTECTPKAVENRLYSWKKKNTTVPGDSDAVVPSTPKKAAPKAKKDAAASRTPRAKKSAAKKVGSGAEDDEDELVSPSKGRKRAAKGEDGGKVKKVKTEPAEEDEDEDEELGAGDMEEV